MSDVMTGSTVGAGARSLAARVAAPWMWTAVREIALMAAVFLGYRQIRFLARDHTDTALANADRVLDLQRGWFVSERTVQDVALRSETLIALLNRYYVGVHFPITILFVLWLLLRRPDWYRTMRNWLIVVTGAALAIHVAFPLAPPRMLPGFVDTLDVYGPDIYPSDHTQSVANQFAAMPSLHFGWSAIVAAGFIVVVRGRWRWLAVLHPVVTLLAIVATGNHYWLDAAVAGVLVVAVGVPLVRRARAGRALPVAPVPPAAPCPGPLGCPRPHVLSAPVAWPATGGRRTVTGGARHDPDQAARRSQAMREHPSSAGRRDDATGAAATGRPQGQMPSAAAAASASPA